ncbi:DUF411 domain-containing protein [Nitrincola sp.]|uniref:DUF411 domain-containing protein n=1 Tax=Nitrincola sp. TaxID=1926584 RepID=UPI003A917109
MKTKFAIISTAFLSSLLLVLISGNSAAEPVMQVYKSETCGCCQDWIDHIEAAGIPVESTNLNNMNSKKMELGVPSELASCHTAVIDGYVIEGHVPASDILRLLREKPAVTGLTVPGMPHGSPGMETGREDPYQVLAFDSKDKELQVWSEYNQP